jgi:dihydrodipicolinate synthase/N-acetylneuraminate lyase
MSITLRGIFPVLQTPLTKDGELDIKSLKREVNFCIQAGAHGLVYPVLGSEFQFLTESERHQLVEVVVSETNGRLPVVVGVAGQNKSEAIIHAKHAEQVKADAVIALPPSSGTLEEIKDYYEAIAQTAQRPVFIQHTHAGMDISFLKQLLDEIEFISYVKEESHPSAHQISSVLEKAGSSCLGVFGGAHGRWMLSELHRGANGFMPAVEAIDVHVQIWDAYQSGDEAGARKIFNCLLPLINLISILGLCVCKEVLIMRGVFESAVMRMPDTVSLDAEDKRELEIIIEGLKPLFRVPKFV